MRKLREILVPHGMKARLKKDTGYSETTIKFALRGVIDTDIAMTIRKRALEMGGALARQ